MTLPQSKKLALNAARLGAGLNWSHFSATALTVCTYKNWVGEFSSRVHMSLLARATFGFQRNYAVECCAEYVPCNCGPRNSSPLWMWMYITHSALISDLLLIPNSLAEMQIASSLMEGNREMRRRRRHPSGDKKESEWFRFFISSLGGLCVFGTRHPKERESAREVLKVKWHSLQIHGDCGRWYLFLCAEWRERELRRARAPLYDCCYVRCRFCALFVCTCRWLRVNACRFCFRGKWIVERAMSTDECAESDPFAHLFTCRYMREAAHSLSKHLLQKIFQ